MKGTNMKKKLWLLFSFDEDDDDGEWSVEESLEAAINTAREGDRVYSVEQIKLLGEKRTIKKVELVKKNEQ